MSEELEKASDDLTIAKRPEVVAVDNRSRNQALLSYWALPSIFLTVALLGGLRVGAADRAFIFFPPPLITLLLAVLLAQGVSVGTLDAPMFAPATGYISFFTLGLYIAGLLVMSFNEQIANSKQ